MNELAKVCLCDNSNEKTKNYVVMLHVTHYYVRHVEFYIK